MCLCNEPIYSSLQKALKSETKRSSVKLFACTGKKGYKAHQYRFEVTLLRFRNVIVEMCHFEKNVFFHFERRIE